MFPKKQLRLFFITGVLLLSLHAYYYYLFVADDSFISFRYVNRLLEGKGLTWTEGQPVEGYSNLLWILVLAGIRRLLGGELWVIALVLNWLFSIITFWLLLKTVARATAGNRTALWWSTLLFALSAPVAIWVNGGLEAPLVMVLLMLTIDCVSLPVGPFAAAPPHYRYQPFPATGAALLAGVFAGLVALTRPDGILFAWAISLAIVIAAFLLMPRGKGNPLFTRLAALRYLFRPLFLFNFVAIAFYTGQLLFRLNYYGEWVPNTALVKIGFTLTRLREGLVYIARMLAVFVPFFVLLVMMFRRQPATRALQAFLVVIIAVPVAYLALIGGDIFPGYRHVLPLVPLLCASAGIVMMDMRRRELARNATYYGAAFLLLVFVLGIQLADGRIREARKERWEWNGMGLGETLKKGFGKEYPSIATTAAGALPFYSGLPTLDMLGLNDYYLPRHPPANFGKGYLGHELGDAGYYLRQSPDIFFLFGLGSPMPYFSGEIALFYHDGFKKDYERVHLRYHLNHRLPLPAWQKGLRRAVTVDDSCYMFVKKYSSRIGIRITPLQQLIIPAYFLRNSRLPDSSATTYLSKTGEFVLSIAPGETYFLDSRHLQPLVRPETLQAKNIVPVTCSRPLQVNQRDNRLEVYNAGSTPVELSELRVQL